MQTRLVAILMTALLGCGNGSGNGDGNLADAAGNDASQVDAAGGTDAGPDAGEREGVSCEFTACGGDPTGTWNFGDICFALEGLVDPECPTATLEISLEASGTLDMVAGGTYTVNATFTTTFETTLPASCLPPELESCDELDFEDDEEVVTCTGDPAVSCTCKSVSTEDDEDSGTWSVNGNTLLLDGEDEAELCVDGDVFTFRFLEEDEDGKFEMVVELTR